jgi:pyruvate dehydrogenase E2 component (dihydrolipoamide acetyltransferase)
MAAEIKMPQLSDTMHSGKILSWRKNEGERIERGDILAEVETDKANLEIESFHQGVLLKITLPAGSTANVGEVIAYIGEPGEDIGLGGNEERLGQREKVPGQGDIAAAPAPEEGLSTHTHIKASPLARAIARQQNIDLYGIQGSGPAGRIIRKDVENIVGLRTSGKTGVFELTARINSASDNQPTVGGRLSQLSSMREAIARRMQQSAAEAPHFYVTTAVNMQAAVKLRAVLNDHEGFQDLNLNHLILKAAAYALTQERGVNSAIRDDMLFEPDAINIGIVTATKEGLLIPVIHSADRLDLKDCVSEVNAAIERVRAGRPKSQDLVGGTFTISNMGMFDVENFTAIISPGQGAILAVSSAKETPIVERGVAAIGLIMKATLSVDHRVIDGVAAAKFLKVFKAALEEPALMML